ncbi:probable glutamate receptor [Argiope bruennichi]|nr:probable glutamate receptor [Argiope bruennichi]
MTWPQSLEFKKNLDGNPEISGFDGKFLQLILDNFGVDFELMIPPDEEFGRKTTNGSWTGLIGMVQREEVDLSFGSLIMTSERKEAVSFSIPYTMTGMTFVYKTPPYEFSNFTYVYPFDILTWCLSLCSMFIITYIFFLVLRRKLSFDRILLEVYGSFLNQSLNVTERRKKWKWLFGLWLLFVVVLSFAYTACLLSVLFIPIKKDEIKTFRQLSEGVQKGTHRALPPKGSFIIDYLATSEIDYLRIIGEEIVKNKDFNDPTQRDKPLGSDIVHLTTREELEFYFVDPNSRENYILGIEDIAVSPVGIALRKNFSYTEKLNKIISATGRAGLFQKFMSDEYLKVKESISRRLPERKLWRQLSINNLAGVFLFLLLGLSFSMLTLIFEIIYYNFSK